MLVKKGQEEVKIRRAKLKKGGENSGLGNSGEDMGGETWQKNGWMS